jgi:signal transduction histidine kinase
MARWGMAMVAANDGFDLWERRATRIFAAIPYGLLGISVVISLFVRGGFGTDTLLDFALASLAALWMLWMVTLHPSWTERQPRMALFFAGLIALMAVLVVRAPWFGFFAWAGYVLAARLLKGRLLVPGIAAVAVLSATSQNGGLPSDHSGSVTTYGILIVVNMLIAGLMVWFSYIGNVQHSRRKEMVAALTEANRKLEESLRENAGLHAQLLTQAREAGILDERQRMAREIHDTLAQGFTGIIAQLEAAKRAHPNAEQWREHVDRAQRLARESLVEARRSVQALQPEPLEHARLPDAIAATAARWSEANGVELSVGTVGEPTPLLAEIEVTLFRAAQEALTNIAKHARASRVGVTLSYLDDLVLLDVRDNGIGFCVDGIATNGGSSDGHGFGLRAMRQRVRQVAGNLTIESAPGEGTAINVSVPAIPAGGSA